ncbi:MAG TPA: EAL domain-containing protein [Xanthobacteraceae bacterium]|nr:EAL domain-containing protein [Xanthobacteraceae bacterium]
MLNPSPSQKAEKDSQTPSLSADVAAFVEGFRKLDRAGTWPIATLISCGLVLIAGVALVTAVLVSELHNRALQNSEREVRNIALVLAEQSDRIFESLAIVQNSLVDRFRASATGSRASFERVMSSYDVHRMLEDCANGLPAARAISVIGADGRILNFSHSWPVPELNIADRKFFRTLKSTDHLDAMVSEPQIDRYTGHWSIYFGRKIVTPSGEFIGVITSTIDLSYFENLFGSLALGPHASIAVFRTDGVLLVRYPRLESMIGEKFTRVIEALHDGGGMSGTLRIVARMDDKDRLIAVHRLSNYPLAISAGLDIEDVFANWQRESRFLIAAGALAALAIATLVALVVRQLMRANSQAQRKLVAQKRQLDTALNNMSQGLCMFDSAARLVVCNERYMEMYGLTPETAKPGCTVADLLESRKRAGSFSGDPQRYCAELLAAIARGKPYRQLIETAEGRTIQIVNHPMAEGGWVATHEDISDRRRSERQIAYMARHDTLTDLANRALFLEKIQEALALLRRTGRGFSVFVLDLDEFKTVNDSLGHPIGDALLKAVADRLRAATREVDTVARLGGDEFAILQPAEENQREAAITLASRLLDAIGTPFEIAGHQVVVGTSIGIALAPHDGNAADQLLKNADLALYRVKAEGRNGFRLFELAMESEALLRHALGVDLRNAISRGDFELHYQPVFDAGTREARGAEALVRWRHPERGLISPDRFIPLAEETGLIVPLGEWVLRRACQDASTWPFAVRIAVNLSPTQFQRGNLVETVTRALVDSSLCPERLELEITESVLLQKNADNLAMLHELKSLGVSIVLDDFGTGYSSLSYLRMFPFDKIKIDRSFVAELSSRADCAAIICAITGLGKSLNITTTAEGVETQEQFELLRAAGVDELQGYLLGRPCPNAQLDFAPFVPRRHLEDAI